MGKIKRLATLRDNLVDVPLPSVEELEQRKSDYPQLAPMQFAKKYRRLYDPTSFVWKGKTFSIQLNTCTNPFCRWFGMPQTIIGKSTRKPIYRYRLKGNPKEKDQRIVCNAEEPLPRTGYLTWGCNSVTLSNWAAVEEIKRLVTQNSVQNIDETYVFHREACLNAALTPLKQPKSFYKRGTSSSNSQKWQCKTCLKLTNVLPDQRRSFNYHQQRNEVLYMFAKNLTARTPVKRTCEILEIGSSTYYAKLELLYKRCLEFLEKHEAKPLQDKTFKRIWINTDKILYHLNNVRKKGHGKYRYDNLEDNLMQTHIVVSADVHSHYVFASDLAYDWDISLTDIERDTLLYKDDHLDESSRKNARLRFSFAPQPPTSLDLQTTEEYVNEFKTFERRKAYIDGLHVNSTYTTFAQFWLLKQKINAKEWRFVTDEDSSISTALYRAFQREVRIGEAHHFLCKMDRTKTRAQAFREFQEGKADLQAWALSSGVSADTISQLAYLYLKEKFEVHRFDEEIVVEGNLYRRWAKRSFPHPLPTRDKGWFTVDALTDLSAYEPEQLVQMVLQVSDHATNAFIQMARRRLSILERPLVTTRGDGKSYIYANFNPKYAQMAITILRTFYNFCMPYKTKDKVPLTPAQRLGIAGRKYEIKDIIYFS
ncbi:insertion element protein [Paenibacillus odorifer]|uniref:insertion element protein n=1 Tax=Paenibacillus TaxID=44249 RepID=UPI00096E7555|nr:insertion element protein [Paenibacillus odorifer]OMD90639.1 insertion element protein [Paenibacillus odorifer]